MENTSEKYDRQKIINECVSILKKAGCNENVINHLKVVEKTAFLIASQITKKGFLININHVIMGAMLHDIGRAQIHDITHAIKGREIAEKYNIEEGVINIIERHIGGGITKEEASKIGLPEKDYIPETLEEKIVSHADNMVADTLVVNISHNLEKLRNSGLLDAALRVEKLHKELSDMCEEDINSVCQSLIDTEDKKQNDESQNNIDEDTDIPIFSVIAMGLIFIIVQLFSILLSPYFASKDTELFDDPENIGNSIFYIFAILIFTGIILLISKYKGKNLIKYFILGAIFFSIQFVLSVPLGEVFGISTGGYIAGAISFVTVLVLNYYPEWYIVNFVAILLGISIVTLFGISFGLLPALVLLSFLAIYDAIAVYRTKHMVKMADDIVSLHLPILLAVPKKRGFRYMDEEGLKQGKERDVMYIGLGDYIIPNILPVSAYTFLPDASFYSISSPLVVAIFTAIGILAGFTVLMRFVLKGNPQAGLPSLNGGAIAGYIIGCLIVYGRLMF